MSDNITIFGQTYTNVTGIKATDDNGNTVTFESGGGGITWEDYMDYSKPSGECVFAGATLPVAFAYARTGMTSFVGDNVTTLGAYGGQRIQFVNNAGVRHISLGKLTTLYGAVFSGCSSLESINLPKVTSTSSNYIFNGCSCLIGVVLPSFTGSIQSQYIVDSACVAFKYLDMTKDDGATRSIMQNAFNGASNFDTLIIRGSTTVEGLANISAFANTPFASGGAGGTLYVPSSLISSYQSATNWSTILGYANNQIKSIESTHTDPDAPIDLTLYYADGTPISA